MKKSGFTLVELLIVIAIIGILASVVLVSSQSGVAKARKASALTTAASTLTELTTCMDDGGGVNAPNSGTAGGGVVCTATGHTTAWPDITNTGWTYVAAADADISDGSYTFTLTKASETTITCSLSTGSCS